MMYMLIIIIGVVLDQIFKYLTVTKLSEVATFPLIENVFHLTYVKNTGAAFSMLSGKQGFLIAMTLIVIIFIFYYIWKNKNVEDKKWVVFSIAMIQSGAIGNLIDRIRLNYVIDYFDFRLINFAVFNFADVLIVCGTILLGILMIVFNKDI
ncbi:MAG: signal peptidase II [Firmicutes bacterium]|nr:signal peptidase II [Bacillota bacterium]